MLVHYAAFSTLLLVAGALVDRFAWRMNKQLWSTSYLLFTAGATGATLALAYAAVDTSLCSCCDGSEESASEGREARSSRSLLSLFSPRLLLEPVQRMGKNAILVFFLHGSLEAVINGVYVNPPKVGGGFEFSLAEQYKGALLEDGGWIRDGLLRGMGISDLATRQIVYVVLKVAGYMALTWWCFAWGYFWKV